jgi:hypothetical protein
MAETFFGLIDKAPCHAIGDTCHSLGKCGGLGILKWNNFFTGFIYVSVFTI